MDYCLARKRVGPFVGSLLVLPVVAVKSQIARSGQLNRERKAGESSNHAVYRRGLFSIFLR